MIERRDFGSVLYNSHRQPARDFYMFTGEAKGLRY
jgi:hypothetical protein